MRSSAAEKIDTALHELATNALKYGALSAASGRVAVSWNQAQDGGLVMDWRESGGPPVTPSSTRGFGSRLIVDVPRGKVHAQVTSNYAPPGLSWYLVAPVEGVLA